MLAVRLGREGYAMPPCHPYTTGVSLDRGSAFPWVGDRLMLAVRLGREGYAMLPCHPYTIGVSLGRGSADAVRLWRS
jgi:hypothetical protein